MQEPLRDPEAVGLIEFVAASPTPYHAAAAGARMLAEAGLTPMALDQEWEGGAGSYLIRGGTLIAFLLPERSAPDDGWVVVGAHSDSPNLRLRPRPDLNREGYRQLAVEVYGGPLLNSWLDRDLGISGRAVVMGASGPETRLFLLDLPLVRVPQLAVHLDREVNDKGLRLDRQTQLVPIWGLGGGEPPDFAGFLGEELRVGPEALLSWDAMLHPVEPPRIAGRRLEFISSPRLDNLASAYAGVRALCRLAGSRQVARPTVLAIFDHEEVGSSSTSGAAGALLPTVLERLGLSRGGGRADHLRSLVRSQALSVDVGHAVHPNYQERYEPAHLLRMNSGPAIKVNSNQRYATDSETAAGFVAACRQAGVPVQWYSHRGDLPCGSTIGPLLATRLGVPTVDVGIPVLAMHSAREMAGAEDPHHMVEAILAFANR